MSESGPRQMSRWDRRALTGAASAVVCLAAVLGVPSVASAAPTTPSVPRLTGPASVDSPEAQAVLRAQRPYAAAAKRIQDAVAGSTASGFAGIALRSDHVELWWQGPVPSAVQRVINAQRRSVTVVVRSATYSREQLKAEAEVVAATMRANPAGGMHAVEIPVDGSRVIAAFDPGTVTSTSAAEVRAGARAARERGLVAGAQATNDIPIEVVERTRPTMNSGQSRSMDGVTATGQWVSFSGGAKISNDDTGAFCSSGFGVYRGGQTYLLTAGHCGRVGGGFTNANYSRWIGAASDEHVYHDLLLVPAPADRNIWDGSSYGDFTKQVTGWDWARAGEMVCQSGATSGAVCGFYNTDSFVYEYCPTAADMYGHKECYGDMVVAATSGWEGTRAGDSGGPVFVPTGGYDVVAKGTVSGRANSGSVLIYQDFATARTDLGIDVITW